jgi:hypothetical protein
LIVDVNSGQLEWIVNGYQPLATTALTETQPIPIGGVMESLMAKAAARIGDIEVGQVKIGELAQKIEPFVREVAKTASQPAKVAPQTPRPPEPKKKGSPPVLRPIK